MRQIVLDTETTGLSVSKGHRIIEIGCVELIDREITGKVYQQYINPDREIDIYATNVHGITKEFLQDKPLFHDIADDFIDFIQDSEMIIHNAEFDMSFIHHEMMRIKKPFVRKCIDTLKIARLRHPKELNNLNALCARYGVDVSGRNVHGALLDAQLLTKLYLLMS